MSTFKDWWTCHTHSTLSCQGLLQPQGTDARQRSMRCGTCLCDGDGPCVVGHVVVEVQPPQLLRAPHELRHRLAGPDGAAHVLERQLLQRCLQTGMHYARPGFHVRQQGIRKIFSASGATLQASVEAPTLQQAAICSAAGHAGRPVTSGSTHTLLPVYTLRLLLQAALCGAG